MVTESELAAVLEHCRALQATADEVVAVIDRREPWVRAALRPWRGPTRVWMTHTVGDEASQAAICAARLRAEADGWAQAWADALNAHNAAEVARREAQPGGGVFQRQPLAIVAKAPPPTAHNGYAPTGTLL